MGLDQYAYAKPSYESDEQEEIAYWRKHNRLQGWMEQLWEDKGRPDWSDIGNPLGDFNCQPVELTLTDLEQLEAHIENKVLPETQGFFFGNDSYADYEGEYGYKETDLKFIEDARKAIEEGKKVYYNCWW